MALTPDNIVRLLFAERAKILSYISWWATLPLRALAQLTLKIKSDRLRAVRIELDTDNERVVGRRARFGWDVTANPAASTITKVTGLLVSALPAARGPDGLVPAGAASDEGWMEVDDIVISTR